MFALAESSSSRRGCIIRSVTLARGFQFSCFLGQPRVRPFRLLRDRFDLTRPPESAGKLVKGKQKSVTDGPFAEAKDAVDGYTLIEARDLDQAVELSMGCPIFELDGECHRNCATEGPERGIEELRAMADSERLTNYPF